MGCGECGFHLTGCGNKNSPCNKPKAYKPKEDKCKSCLNCKNDPIKDCNEKCLNCHDYSAYSPTSPCKTCETCVDENLRADCEPCKSCGLEVAHPYSNWRPKSPKKYYCLCGAELRINSDIVNGYYAYCPNKKRAVHIAAGFFPTEAALLDELKKLEVKK